MAFIKCISNFSGNLVRGLCMAIWCMTPVWCLMLDLGMAFVWHLMPSSCKATVCESCTVRHDARVLF